MFARTLYRSHIFEITLEIGRREQEILYLETKSNTKQVIAFPSYNIKAETITLNSRDTSDISFTQINVSKNSKQLKTVRENVNPHKQ